MEWNPTDWKRNVTDWAKETSPWDKPYPGFDPWNDDVKITPKPVVPDDKTLIQDIMDQLKKERAAHDSQRECDVNPATKEIIDNISKG